MTLRGLKNIWIFRLSIHISYLGLRRVYLRLDILDYGHIWAYLIVIYWYAMHNDQFITLPA